MKELKLIDGENDLAIDFKTGGDGDNGELLLYYLDAIFEQREGRLDAVIKKSHRCEHGVLKCGYCFPRE